MVAVDTNILIYSHRAESPWYAAARNLVELLAASALPWAIPWPCIHEFLSVATSRRVFKTPTPLDLALQQVEYWMASSSLRLLSERPGHWAQMRALMQSGLLSGPLVHDAHIAALCLGEGVEELWTADRDFSRMPALKTRNPLVQAL